MENDSYLPLSSFEDLSLGKSVVSVHLSSVAPLRFKLANGTSSSLEILTGSELDSLVAALVLSAGSLGYLLEVVTVVGAVDVSSRDSVEPCFDWFLVAARVLRAGLSELSSSLAIVSALYVALAGSRFVSSLVAARALPTGFF